MPAHTGESISEWSRCVQAWEMGWREATAQRLARCDRAAMLGALTHNH
ncbi:CrpP-related protein [Achromobacter sp. 2789STDY5608615]|nr:CrpP-related protein [Achromobacter sp. 2789STDY5608615]